MKKLRLLLAVAGLTLLWSCSKDNGKEEEPQPKPVNVRCVGISGHDFVQPDGSRLYIKGVNLGNWLNQEGYMFGLGSSITARGINEMFCQLVGPDYTRQFWRDFLDNYITLDDMKFIKSTGANTVRLPIHYKMFTHDDWMGINDPAEGYKILDRVIGWCKETGLYLILGMHAAPGGNNGDKIDDSYYYPWLYESEVNRKLLCDVWRDIADHCKAEPIVLAYDLIEEPIPAMNNDLNGYLQPLLKEVTLAIRKVDPNHLVMWGGANYNDDFTVFDTSDLAFDDKICFTCHRFGSMYIDNFTSFRDKVNRPMFMGGWGHGENSEWMHSFAKVLRDNNIGYTTWPYKLLGSYSSFVGQRQPENWDKIMEFEKAPRMNYDDIKAAREKVGQDVARKAMADFIETSKFNNCEKLDWYIRDVRMGE